MTTGRLHGRSRRVHSADAIPLEQPCLPKGFPVDISGRKKFHTIINTSGHTGGIIRIGEVSHDATQEPIGGRYGKY